MKELYKEIADQIKRTISEKRDSSMHTNGAVVLKRLLIYTLECGYTYDDLQNIFFDEEMEKLSKRDHNG